MNQIKELLGTSCYYERAVTDAETGEEVLQLRILGDLPASLIQRLTLELGEQVPVDMARVRFDHGSTILEWPILKRTGSVSLPSPSRSGRKSR
jgi:hypothetical protein